MTRFVVAWSIDVEDSHLSPLKAAQRAREIHHRSDVNQPDSACVYRVTNAETGESFTVDLCKDERGNPTIEPAPRDVLEALRPILADMLAYEADKFEGEILGWYVHSGPESWGPFDEEADAKAFATSRGLAGYSVAAELDDLDVSGADLVDAWSEWRPKILAALAGEA